MRVADPVHGYVLVTSLERTLLDTRLAQRLRYVGQSGLAHLVFPDLRTSRFIHSLGTMHLASRFLAASLAHADAAARPFVHRAIAGAVQLAVGDFGDPERAASDLESDGLLCGVLVDEAQRASALLVEQGLRLAALFHDLGHLPFSHDFEYALEALARDSPTVAVHQARPLLEQRSGRDALHERIGHDLTYLLLKQLFSQEPNEAARICFALARRILESSEEHTGARTQETGGFDSPANGAFAWLHTLIAGELDVDRCDYVLRDGRNYGFEFAGFDLARLIDNLTVVKLPAENALAPAIRPQGQAAVESFLIARARMYQWGPRHHKVAQIGAALRYARGELLRPALTREPFAPVHPLRPFLDDVEQILLGERSQANPEDLLDRFAHYDDQWWMTRLREAPPDEWTSLICWRTRGPRSLWKRPTDFPGELHPFNIRLPGRTDLTSLAAWEDVVRDLRQHGILVIRHRFEPWRPSAATRDHPNPQSALSFYDPDRGLISVSSVARNVAALRDAWMHDVQVHAFARSDARTNGAMVLERLLQGATT